MVTVVLHFRPSVVCSSNGSPNLTTVRVETKISCENIRKQRTFSRKLTNVAFFFYFITKGKHFQRHVNQKDHFCESILMTRDFREIMRKKEENALGRIAKI
jgi:hypothetical protein